MTKGADRRAARAARVTAREAEATRARRRGQFARVALTLLGVAVAALVGWRLYVRATEASTWQTFADQGNRHLPSAQSVFEGYNSDPPTSGPHAPVRPRWGVYGSPIPKVLQVHGLEDGGVLVQYNCPHGCPDLVAQLQRVVARYPEYVILAPYPGMRPRIALTAWRRLDASEEFDEARIVRFIERFKGIDHHKG
jgi:hypothetical protein